MPIVAFIRKLVPAALAVMLVPSTASAQDCDRACLGGMVTAFVDALVAGEPTGLPLADKVKMTENSGLVTFEQGLWDADLAPGTFRHDYLDTKAQVAAAHVELRENGNPVLLSFALHIENSQIAGIETLVERITPESVFQPSQLGQPVRGMDRPLAASERTSRDDLVATALTYTEGLRIGNFSDGRTPFSDEAYRVENGVITAGEGCLPSECGMYAQRVMLHPAIVPSVIAVDEENGTVLLWMNFGDTNSYGPGNALVTFEAFKIWRGEIHAVNAFFTFLPASTPRFWDSVEPVPNIY